MRVGACSPVLMNQPLAGPAAPGVYAKGVGSAAYGGKQAKPAPKSKGGRRGSYAKRK